MVRLVVGVVLMVLAFAELFLFIGGPENKMVADVMTSVTCQQGERFIQVLGGYVYDSDGGRGQSFNFYCQDDAGNKRDVTGEGMMAGILGYIVPFILGLILLIVGVNGKKSRPIKKAAKVGTSVGFTTGVSSGATDPFGKPINANDFRAGGSGAQVRTRNMITLNGKEATLSDLPPEAAEVVQNLFSNLGSMSSGKFVMESSDLTDKLQQLKEAHEKNLITQEEYDRLRKAILDHLSSE